MGMPALTRQQLLGRRLARAMVRLVALGKTPFAYQLYGAWAAWCRRQGWED